VIYVGFWAGVACGFSATVFIEFILIMIALWKSEK
jgi:hypothetical protein